MVVVTRAKISTEKGIIELEGDEAFVRSYLDQYQHLVLGGETTAEDKSRPTQTVKSAKTSKKAATPKKAPSTKQKSKKGGTKITAERFDIHGNGNAPSLESFIAEKKPSERSNPEKIVVIAYYITEYLKADTFTEGQIEYAYKMLKFRRPGHLRQILINTKNDKDWVEQNDDGTAWMLTRTGEIFVSDNLPKADL